MSSIRAYVLAAVLAALLAGGCSTAPQNAAPAQANAGFAVIPPNKDNDLKLYHADGRILKGPDALARMQQEAELILWLAGMVLMVAKGNPKKIRGIADVQRSDVRTSMPNPVNEGIMQFYGRKVLERHKLWTRVSAGKECFSCQTTPNNWFTAVHHRETPDRILAGQSDTGIVWITEAIEAQRAGKAIEAVQLPPQDSLRDEVAYAIGALDASPRKAAMRYLAFLATPQAQAAYAKYGFVNATAQELALKPIP